MTITQKCYKRKHAEKHRKEYLITTPNLVQPILRKKNTFYKSFYNFFCLTIYTCTEICKLLFIFFLLFRSKQHKEKCQFWFPNMFKNNWSYNFIYDDIQFVINDIRKPQIGKKKRKLSKYIYIVSHLKYQFSNDEFKLYW